MVFPLPSGAITHWVTNESYKCVLFASKDGGQISAARRTDTSAIRGSYRSGLLICQQKGGRRKIRKVMIFVSSGIIYIINFLLTLCAECSCVHIDPLPAFVVACNSIDYGSAKCVSCSWCFKHLCAHNMHSRVCICAQHSPFSAPLFPSLNIWDWHHDLNIL